MLIQTVTSSYSFFSDSCCIVFWNLIQFPELDYLYNVGRAPELAPLSWHGCNKYIGLHHKIVFAFRWQGKSVTNYSVHLLMKVTQWQFHQGAWKRIKLIFERQFERALRQNVANHSVHTPKGNATSSYAIQATFDASDTLVVRASELGVETGIYRH